MSLSPVRASITDIYGRRRTILTLMNSRTSVMMGYFGTRSTDQNATDVCTFIIDMIIIQQKSSAASYAQVNARRTSISMFLDCLSERTICQLWRCKEL